MTELQLSELKACIEILERRKAAIWINVCHSDRGAAFIAFYTYCIMDLLLVFNMIQRLRHDLKQNQASTYDFPSFSMSYMFGACILLGLSAKAYQDVKKYQRLYEAKNKLSSIADERLTTRLQELMGFLNIPRNDVETIDDLLKTLKTKLSEVRPMRGLFGLFRGTQHVPQVLAPHSPTTRLQNS